MTKEKLEKEIRQYLREQFNYVYEDDVAKVKGFAEQQEKRIEELKETINKLREQLALRYSLEDKIKELEQQIQDIVGVLNDILWKCTCKEYEKATQELKELINKWEIKENE